MNKKRFKIGDRVVVAQMDLFDNSLLGKKGTVRGYRQTAPVSIELELDDKETHVIEEAAVEFANINDMYGTTERF